MHYLKSHWRGEQSFARSFWINLVGLRLVVLLAQQTWLNLAGEPRGLPVAPLVLGLLVVHGLLFIWQAVGVVRSAETHMLNFGSRASVLGSQLVTVVLLLLTLSYAIEAYQTTLAPPPAEHFSERMTREHEASYAIDMLDGGHAVRLRGLIALGVTRRLRLYLEQHPQVGTVVLESRGGNVYEGRGLAKLFFERRLDTRVDVLCASACTLAFIGGQRRTVHAAARFGLHGYRLDSDYAILVTDAESEQRRDRALFRRAGVAAWFVRRMFDAGADDMWWPTPGELLRAGVAHQLRQ